MGQYNRSKEDFRELLYLKYKPMEEENILWCLGDWAENTDYVLCNWDSDLLPPLVKKDEIRFEYNQWANQWSKVSCTIFAAMGMLSDLINYEFSEKELKEVDELSYERWRIRWHWWYVQSAVKLVADWYNESDLSNKYGKIAYYRISKYDNEILEDAISKLYTIDWNMCPTTEFVKDYKEDWMVDGTDFWHSTNWHSIDVISKWWQRSIKDSYKWRKTKDGKKDCNIYGLKNQISALTNFWANFYVYVLVNDKLEEVKRLNEIKAECNLLIEHLGTLWHLVNDTNFQWVLHYTAEKLRKKIDDCNNELKKYI